ncbi:MAG: YraN family protein [Betaproteobacteria bacterium]|nr:YraN family protein [Betaproteobacteria bacterium]
MTSAARLGARRRGEEAEELATRYLADQGLSIIARNYRTRFGEVDLVAQDGATLVFVEVRARSWSAFGGAAGSVDSGKQRRVVAAARHYIARLRAEPPCRFDVITLQGPQGDLAWIRGAFEST